MNDPYNDMKDFVEVEHKLEQIDYSFENQEAMLVSVFALTLVMLLIVLFFM